VYQYDIFDYRINDDGIIDVQGDVNFVRRNPYTCIGFQSILCMGVSDCSQNIISFIGAPN
jgi:hypothetical protein